ncbi:hypothetical protein IIA15_01025 [candidate division TA06 bacterium]|nr:hypothetical protein [candidate division TA06 bacterium]
MKEIQLTHWFTHEQEHWGEVYKQQPNNKAAHLIQCLFKEIEDFYDRNGWIKTV